jgi:predicted dinucleotide-binding enzyme
VLLASPGAVVAEALAGVSGLSGKIILDATNRLASQTSPPPGHDSVAEYVKATTGGPVAKVFITSTTEPSWARPPAPLSDRATSGSATRTPVMRSNS